ncbi:MAG: TRAP transporter small permease subunit [Parvularcula sp.]
MLIITATLFYLSAIVPLMARMTGHHGLAHLSKIQASAYAKLTGLALKMSAVSGLGIALVQMFTLITRNIFGVNFIAVQESLLYLFGAMVLLGAGGILLADGHVRVDVFYSHWSERRKRLVDILGTYLFLLPVCILIAVAAQPYVLQSWAVLERSQEPTGIPAVFLLKTLIPIFSILVGMAGIVRLHQLLVEDSDV